MGIDALVFCDCLEKGGLRKEPKPEWQVYVQEDGCRESASSELRHQAAFGHWHETACPHDYGILMHRRFNSASVAALLLPCPENLHVLPPVLRRILSLPTAQSDRLDAPALHRLLEELSQIRNTAPPACHPLLDDLQALAAAALRIGKPLVF
ncbi:MAG TPA: hypothetical protein VFW42_02280 [Fluviicoccus sp.]|nr:hypothetical protein [Fluviicoccus sp.]